MTAKRIELIALLLGATLFAGAAQAQKDPERSTTLSETNAPPEVKRKLQQMRGVTRSNNLGYSVGYTSALTRSKSELMGDVDDPTITPEQRAEQNRRAQELIQRDNQLRSQSLKDKRSQTEVQRTVCNPSSAKFNWYA